MYMTKRAWSVLGFGLLSILCVYAQTSSVLPDPAVASWPVWGADFRRSHHTPTLVGPSDPVVRWFLPGGALEEPAYVGLLEFDTLTPASAGWVPQRAIVRTATTTVYSRFSGLTGMSLQAVYPFWGQPVTPMFINIPIIYFVNNNPTPPPPGFPTSVYARVTSGGQYEFQIYSPVPADLIALGLSPLTPPFAATVRGVPNYRANGVAYGMTLPPIGQITVLSFASSRRNIDFFAPYWRVNIAVSGAQIQIQNAFGVLVNLGRLGVPGSYGVASANANGSLLVYGFHNGSILALDSVNLQPVWQTTLTALSNNQITSDAVDRPVVITSNNQLGIVCASNAGQIFGVSLSNGARVWSYNAGGGIMGGPSVGPDPVNGGEDTVYVVVRSERTSVLHAIRASNGSLKWTLELNAFSRCTPTIDADGKIYLGDDRGTLYIIDPSGSVRRRLALGAPIRVAPVLANVFNPETNRVEPTLLVAAGNRFLYAIVDQSLL